MLDSYAREIIAAYFNGSNAVGKTDTQLIAIMKAIIKVVKEEDDKERGEVIT